MLICVIYVACVYEHHHLAKSIEPNICWINENEYLEPIELEENGI